MLKSLQTEAVELLHRINTSDQMNVIPERARLHVDCRVRPGMEEPAVLERVEEVLGTSGYRLEFTEQVVGNASTRARRCSTRCRPGSTAASRAPERLGALAHGRDERVDVRELALAVDCYRWVATEMLG
jgi:acetylornithine deacetylase/succinyl-diaminopimelate desuccinylase-like protein